MWGVEALFLIGNYQGAINEGIKLEVENEEDRIFKDFIVYRAYTLNGNARIVLEEIKENETIPALVAARVYAKYYIARKSQDNTSLNEVLDVLKKWNEDGITSEYIAFIYSIIQYEENNIEESFKKSIKLSMLEGRALLVQIFLKLNRLDLAEKEIFQMQKKK